MRDTMGEYDIRDFDESVYGAIRFDKFQADATAAKIEAKRDEIEAALCGILGLPNVRIKSLDLVPGAGSVHPSHVRMDLKTSDCPPGYVPKLVCTTLQDGSVHCYEICVKE
jgi:hypothetical protein